MRILFLLFLIEFSKKYNLCDLVDKYGYIYIEIIGGMYGLPQSGKIEYEQLKEHLSQ